MNGNYLVKNVIYIYIYIYIYISAQFQQQQQRAYQRAYLGLAEAEWKQSYYIRKIQHFLVIHETGKRKQVKYQNYHGKY